MAQFTPTGRVLPHELTDRFKWDLTGPDAWDEGVQGDSRTGGRMVRVRIAYAEEALAAGGARQ